MHQLYQNLQSSVGLNNRHMNASGVLMPKGHHSCSASQAIILPGAAKSKSKERNIGHFVLASRQFYSPRNYSNNKSWAYNKANITAHSASEATGKKQWRDGLTSFHEARSKEIKKGGSMFISCLGRISMDPTDQGRGPFRDSRDDLAEKACTPSLGASKSELAGRNIADYMQALWIFLRPHTLRGTIFASIAIAARTWIENVNALNWSISLKTFFGLLAILCANSFMVGINQIYDVEIDKVNKPYLPVANGDFSNQAAWLLVTTFGVTGGLIICMLNYGPTLATLYSYILFMAILYSVPPLRLKQFPVAAFLIIASIRGITVNYAAHYATRTALGLPSQFGLPMVFITTFVTVFALAISILKDLPDTEGDSKFKISTFATNFGVRNTAFLGSSLLLLNYLGAIAMAFFNPQVFRGSFMILAHVFLASCLVFQASVLEKKNYVKEASTTFYQFMWTLLCAEFIIFPFI